MQVELWLVVVMGVLSVIGAVSVMRRMVKAIRLRRAVSEALPVLMDLSGKSERVVRAELRAMQTR